MHTYARPNNLVSSDVVSGEVDLHIVCLCLLHNLANNLGALLVKQG